MLHAVRHWTFGGCQSVIVAVSARSKTNSPFKRSSLGYWQSAPLKYTVNIVLFSLSGFPRKNWSSRPRRCCRSPGKRNVFLKLKFIAAIVLMKKATEQEFNSCSERQTMVTVCGGNVASGILNYHYVILCVFFWRKLMSCLYSSLFFPILLNQSSAWNDHTTAWLWNHEM